ncbi:hypothetical protein M9Y10_007293 [Tritrichomonas musculus]|uniref:Uncharacterized protein n=1 Tax=Tritrichomonas musculus TaxID=1915356 RepID=A0ABR2J1W2_9EUKA
MKEVSFFGETIDRDGKVEIKNEDFYQNNQYFSLEKNFVIHDCLFHDINFDEAHDGKSPIQFEGSLPFYMTNCIIREIKGRKSAIHLTMKAATIDHICMYNLVPLNSKLCQFLKDSIKRLFNQNYRSKNHFDFTHGEDTYTLIHYTDIKTPSRSPTKKYSESSAFTFSAYFSFSKCFSESDDFSISFSKYFSKTEDFSETKKFSKTEIFSETEDFTFSFDFTRSKSFTQSDDLDRTRAFTKSNYFSESNDFSQSDDFTKTNGFSKSDDFTKTNGFSKSDDFTKTNGFSKSDDFTKTNGFSKSDDFTKTNGFSKSDDFTFSKYFNESKELKTRIIIFTPPNIFTKSDCIPPAGGVDKHGSGGKLCPGALAGIIVGAIAAAAIVIILAIFFIIKRKKSMDLPTDANIIDGQESTI